MPSRNEFLFEMAEKNPSLVISLISIYYPLPLDLIIKYNNLLKWGDPFHKIILPIHNTTAELHGYINVNKIEGNLGFFYNEAIDWTNVNLIKFLELKHAGVSKLFFEKWYMNGSVSRNKDFKAELKYKCGYSKSIGRKFCVTLTDISVKFGQEEKFENCSGVYRYELPLIKNHLFIAMYDIWPDSEVDHSWSGAYIEDFSGYNYSDIYDVYRFGQIEGLLFNTRFYKWIFGNELLHPSLIDDLLRITQRNTNL